MVGFWATLKIIGLLFNLLSGHTGKYIGLFKQVDKRLVSIGIKVPILAIEKRWYKEAHN